MYHKIILRVKYFYGIEKLRTMQQASLNLARMQISHKFRARMQQYIYNPLHKEKHC